MHSTVCWYLSFLILTSELRRTVIFYILALFWVTLKSTLLEDQIPTKGLFTLVYVDSLRIPHYLLRLCNYFSPLG